MLSTENPRATLVVLKRGLGWLLLAIALDYGTSIIMVLALGTSAEGNAATRVFYQTKTMGAFVSLLVSQEDWMIILGFVLAAFVAGRLMLTMGTAPLTSLGVVCRFGIALAWLMGAARLAIGPASNLSAFFTVVYGQEVGQMSFGLMALITVILVALDFIRTYRRAWGPRGTSQSTRPASQ